MQFAKGDITMELVKAGLARMVDWSIGAWRVCVAGVVRAAAAYTAVVHYRLHHIPEGHPLARS